MSDDTGITFVRLVRGEATLSEALPLLVDSCRLASDLAMSSSWLLSVVVGGERDSRLLLAVSLPGA